MNEIWKDIKEFEGHYQVSNLGNVKSLNYKKMGISKNLVPKKNNKGYLWVELRSNGKVKPMLIHRLVAMAFLPNPNNLEQVNHKDENPLNNCVENIEWCTREYNVRYSIEKHPKKPHKHLKHVLQKTLNGEILKSYPCTVEVARANGYNQWSIIQCCKGKRKQAYGYKWEFID